MTRFIGNRIGNLPFPDGYSGGGLFNTIQHLYYKQLDNWGKFTFSHSGEDLKIPSSTSGDGYNYLIYTGGGSFAVEGWMATSVDFMVVGGGGAGGRSNGPHASGGGGAGGFRTGSFILWPGPYIVSIGAGGASGTASIDSTSGGPSYISGPPEFGSFASTGGGHGGGNTGSFEGDRRAAAGGSGGGGCALTPLYDDTPRDGGLGNRPEVTPPQGYPGGDGSATPNFPNAYNRFGGGGGGANGYGFFQNGGTGRAYPFSYTVLPTSYGTPGPTVSEPPTARWFAGGGGGGRVDPNTTFTSASPGGAGGGGDGATPPSSSFPFTNGTVNTGGGGGGMIGANPSGSGGSGIIIIRYQE